MIPNCHQGNVARQNSHQVVPCSLFSMEICSLTCLVIQVVVNYYQHEMWCCINQSMLEYSVSSSDLQRNEGLWIPLYVVMSYTVSLHLWFINPSWEKETFITWNLPLFFLYLNQYTKCFDRLSLLYSSITVYVINTIWYIISRNPIRNTSSLKVCITRARMHNL